MIEPGIACGPASAAPLGLVCATPLPVQRPRIPPFHGALQRLTGEKRPALPWSLSTLRVDPRPVIVTKIQMAFSNLPRPIVAFLEAAESRDAVALFGTLSDDVVLTNGSGKPGRSDAVVEWIDRVIIGPRASIHPINVLSRDGRTAVTVVVCSSGGGAVTEDLTQLDLWFTIRDGRIATLDIFDQSLPDLPAPVATYVKATNAFDIEALLGAFADDALVNDQFRDYWGKDAIREWAARDIIGDKITMYVVKAVNHYGHSIVTARRHARAISGTRLSFGSATTVSSSSTP
jgi:hypothetical protein